ncbi:TonB-dependent receptor [Puniceicoccales bacterium CK1056]|uniref:TonB-dependent receptor n=1 Tax=Oceanipulchritudo coccoides TaxID=2706888 RepID=A0A6B2LY87_9BACT|nr:TonB-dependent receptor [Oceanipulchritudo coccoides]NDV61313.1 TonB-dependent receptor [Oceanipulchritudo coccoides]
MTSKNLFPHLLAMTGLFLSPALYAQDDTIHELEPVIVRGDLLQSPIERLPASVTILSSAEASSNGAAHLENLLGQIPNLNWAGGTARPRFFQIRGVGENSQFGNELPASSVGFIIDGIDFTGIGSVAGLFDVEQVEVLRGPQAAAFGANALAGMILIETVSPTSFQEGSIEATVGEYDLFSFGFAAGGPVGNQDSSEAAYRISFHKYQDNGYRENRFLGKDSTNARDETSARLKLAWNPARNLDISMTFLYFDFDNGYDAWSLTNNSFITTTDEPGRDEQETVAAGFKAVMHVNEGMDITYQVSGSDTDILYSYDWDWSNPDELESIYGPEVYGGTDVTDRDRRVLTNDLRASSPTGQSGENAWIAGLYHRDFKEEQLYFGTESTYRSETAAIYGQARLRMGKTLLLTLAGRIEDVRIEYSDTLGIDLGNSETPWGGKLALEFKPSEDNVLYASIDRGFKAGGVNLDNDIPAESRVYDSETMWNYELGWRAIFLENRLRLHVTAFYMDRKDIQVDSSIQLGDGNTFALFKDNAASGHNYGLELELDWQAAEWIRFFASTGLLNAAFDSYQYIDPNDGFTQVVLDDREQGYSPDYTYSAGAALEFNSGFFAEASVEGKDGYTFDVANQQSLAAYTLVSLSAGWRTDTWSLTLWANNLLDERYDTRGFYFANEPPAYDNPRKWVSQGSPRQLGLSFKKTF